MTIPLSTSATAANRRRSGNASQSWRLSRGLKVVAEGIEDQAALDAIAGFGCDYAQGNHFSRPLPADAFVASTELRALDTLALGARARRAAAPAPR